MSQFSCNAALLTFLKIIDTGTSLIYLPQADVVKFYAAVRRGSTYQLYFPR
jgi:hypothetical protein